MIGSLRLRLFVVLLGATGAVWIAAVGWIYTSSQRELEHVLDTRLQEAARMVVSLVGSMEGRLPETLPNLQPPVTGGNYERQLSCQVWSLQGTMIARSSGAPEQRLSDQPSGFSERLIDGETWRIYAIEDEGRGFRVLVGDRLGLRDRLVADLIKGLLWPALLIAPLLGVLIWVSVGRGLRPLQAIASDLVGRGADDMRPVDASRAPSEVKPLTEALNALFDKVSLARRHEREITAFAAHELRSPLTALKTQAQVALAANDPAVSRAALQQILLAVDRATRLVRQLLTLARLDAHAEIDDRGRVAMRALIEDVVRATPRADGIVVTVDEALGDAVWSGNRECLELAIRNLHENAVQYMPGGGEVRWRLDDTPRAIIVEDTGPGVPADELDKIGQRFFRGRNKSAIGSGLGLAIASLALARSGAEISFGNRPSGSGFQVRIAIGERPLRSAP
ncbi:two-component system sensor histidine kinase QseC [Rhodopseudomonas thermotolerans]|uniref:histidine kinase n=2 Tax=Rhodopseudomonas TaxID=1073 RepID=A0A336JUM5_9BRAD|nr:MULTISPECIES: ATP-binding protein [Rhodopseudomonas]RED33278.1 two-component system sensor histidine kinase QseC [Rhodopseudomonas pentothenatexigens]REF94027.1 two-component system sensor histidine kinase QseC [Rhodopseudomonas thermotolerans]SSW91354.1 two-component system sensor histidine kinase QseC [Rhodopseudomonas pentothenatexigens]